MSQLKPFCTYLTIKILHGSSNANAPGKATEKLAFDFLKAGMLTGKTDEEIGVTVAGFVTAGDEGTHGSPFSTTGLGKSA